MSCSALIVPHCDSRCGRVTFSRIYDSAASARGDAVDGMLYQPGVDVSPAQSNYISTVDGVNQFTMWFPQMQALGRPRSTMFTGINDAWVGDTPTRPDTAFANAVYVSCAGVYSFSVTTRWQQTSSGEVDLTAYPVTTIVELATASSALGGDLTVVSTFQDSMLANLPGLNSAFGNHGLTQTVSGTFTFVPTYALPFMQLTLTALSPTTLNISTTMTTPSMDSFFLQRIGDVVSHDTVFVPDPVI